MKNQSDAYSEFGFYLHRIAATLDKRGDELFRAKLGISLRQFLLLRLIEAAQQQEPSQQLIADRLGIAKSAVSRHIDIAKEHDWVHVAISELSRKQHVLQLTANGRKLLARAKKLVAQSELEGFGDLPEADVAATLRVLEAIYTRLH